MSNLFKIISGAIIIAAFFKCAYADANLVVSPISPMPSQVVESSIVSNIQYQISNTGDASADVTFGNLNTLGKTFTTTCGTLSASSSCLLNITFNVPALPSGATSEFYPHTAFVLGAPNRVPFSLSTTIIQSATSITPTFNVSLSDSTSCTGQTFTVVLTPSVGSPTTYSSVPCGTSTPSPALAGGTYSAHITPNQITVSSNNYDAPADFNYHLAKAGDAANFVYQLNQDVAVDTNLTMPHDGGATSTIACTGPASYSHAQGVGTTSYDTMKQGIYTCTATNYTGNDSQIYTPTLSNPYTIDATHTVIAISFAAQPPSTVPVSTALTMPNAPSGQLVACTVHDAGNTYNCSQPVGTAHCDNMVAASDYTFSCSNYTVGPDTYSMPTQTNVTVAGPSTSLTGVYSKNAPPGSNYDWHVNHLSSLVNSNIFAIWWGGGSTTAPVQISSNPPINPWLNAQIAAYEGGTPTPIGPHGAVKEFPNYVAMGTILQIDASGSSVTDQLKAQLLDSGFHYEGVGHPSNCFFDDNACADKYTPQVDGLAAQAIAVKATNNHTLITGTAFYTIDYSDYPTTTLGNLTDAAITGNMYNLMYEAYRMEYQYTTNNQPMVLMLNPDSTVIMQDCGQYYCPISWKPGITQDTTTTMVALPNLQADINTAIDRMVSKGYMSSGAGAAMKADLVTNTVLTPPAGSGRTVAGLPEYILSNTWAVQYLAPHIALGLGNNEYDSSNPMLAPTGTVPQWETASFNWIHKVNHIGLSPTDNFFSHLLYQAHLGTITSVPEAVDYEAQKFKYFAIDMNFVGRASDGKYKPDFLYFDRFERDVIPGYVSGGYVLNGVDSDTYFSLYLADIDGYLNNIPLAIWQMPGATMQVQGDTFSGDLSDTVGDWVWGHPELNNDMSNLATALNFPGITWTSDMNNYVYFTKNSKVTNLQEYVKLTNQSP